mmetsp:Transcript_17590/g.29141  ORF Transcript_17590/g.29141 Transcript_17590/m.29141 type:complete len:94 (+) Transcript_17590:1-282(+)
MGPEQQYQLHVRTEPTIPSRGSPTSLDVCLAQLARTVEELVSQLLQRNVLLVSIVLPGLRLERLVHKGHTTATWVQHRRPSASIVRQVFIVQG